MLVDEMKCLQDSLVERVMDESSGISMIQCPAMASTIALSFPKSGGKLAEPVLRQHPEEAGLADALRPREDRHVVELWPGSNARVTAAISQSRAAAR